MKILICLGIVSTSSSFLYPIAVDKLDTSCETTDGVRGIHKLESDCKQVPGEIVGYINSAGPVVCCTEAIRGSKKYCEHFGATKPSLDFHVLEGSNSDEGEFPHMVALGYDNLGDIEFDCGGALLSSSFVVTVAHCVNRKNRLPTVVRAGRTSLDLTDRFDKSSAVDSRVKRVILHSEYSSRSKYHDIALIELEDAIRFRDNVKPICLQSDRNVDESSRNLTIIGFGISNFQTREKSNWLQKAEIKEMPLRECQNRYVPLRVSGLSLGILSSQVCARDDKEKAADTCPGDSGSPLQTTSSNGKYHLVGLTSFGMGCGSSFPSVYTRISYYVDWIESVVWPRA